MKLAALPEDERDSHYDLIRRSCCAAAEHIGQSPDKAAITANDMVEFVHALVGIIEMGCGSDQARSADRPPPAHQLVAGRTAPLAPRGSSYWCANLASPVIPLPYGKASYCRAVIAIVSLLASTRSRQ